MTPGGDSGQLTGNFIGGAWQPAITGATRANMNPADTTDVVGEFAESGPADVKAAVAAATAAAYSWRELGPIKRGESLARAVALLRDRAGEFAAVITRENGKRLSEARGEVARSIAILEFTVGEARRMNGETTPAEDPRTLALTFRVPIGVVGLIAPWNFPLAIPIWKVAPALLAGCPAVLKPSPLTPLTSALMTSVFADAGVPAGVLNLAQGDRIAGEELVSSDDVAGVSFTGSLPVGQAIQHAAAGRLARTQLELGGKNALVVLADADLDAATDAIIHGAYGQAGQRCSATSRVIVERSVKDALLERLTRRVAALRVGPGSDPATDVGPVINEDRLATCLESISQAADEGAVLVTGGQRADSNLPDGYYVQPTILRDVPWDSHLAQEEVFGPVLAVIDADGVDDAIRIANSVKYGMSATVFTRDLSLALWAVQQFEAGMLHVNRPGVGAYAHLPHVGTKKSQFGPPECSPHVWDFYTEWRSACISY